MTTVLYVTAAVVYVAGAAHLIDASLRERPFMRPPGWLVTALGWPLWLVGGAALTAKARVALVLRPVDDGGVGRLR